jgi:hypothetical protein
MKIGNLYNIESFKKFMDSDKQPGFMDAAAGVVLSRNLTQVDPKIFEKLYPELSFVNSGITADNSGGYARRIQSLRLIEQGGFTNAGDVSSNKGKISLSAEDSTLRVMVREAHSTWDEDEVKEADLQNINLVSNYISTHNKIYQRDVDLIGYLGIPDAADSEGLLNYSGFTSGGATGAIGTLTARASYDEIAALITDQWDSVNNTPGYMADRVVMPVSVANVLSTNILDTASGTKSVMRALQDNFPTVTFMQTFRANDVGGASATVAFSSSDEVMKMRIPVPLTIGEIIKVSSFDYRVDSKYRIAGLDVLEDAGARILTGL